MRRGRRTTLIVLAPLVSVATLMIGLRVGAGRAVRSATVFAAPPGNPPSDGAPAPFAWQLLTYLEDRGVRETVPMRDLTVVARSRGQEARWSGASNADGIAEATLALPGLGPGDAVRLEVRAAGEQEPLADGTITLQRITYGRAPDDPIAPSARPSKREGALSIDVTVEGERLVAGFETPLWAHVTAKSGAALDPAKTTLQLEPEPGLRVGAREATLGCDGWAEIAATAEAHVTGIQIDAKTADASGVWFGALPVAPGAFFVGAPRFLPAGKGDVAVLVAPNPRDVVYAEIDDERGRVFAAALPVVVERGDPIPRARLPIPPLAPGLHWLVVSGEPRGAEHLAGAAIAKPFLVGGAPGVRADQACSVGPWLAQRPPTRGFPRWLALDGMETRGARNRARHRIGMAIGLGSLLVAAILEVLLLSAAAREAREVIEGREGRAGGGAVVGILVALLGFAFLAALMIAKA